MAKLIQDRTKIELRMLADEMRAGFKPFVSIEMFRANARAMYAAHPGIKGYIGVVICANGKLALGYIGPRQNGNRGRSTWTRIRYI